MIAGGKAGGGDRLRLRSVVLHQPFGRHRPNEGIADEPDDEERHNDVHRLVVDLRLRNTGGDLRIAHPADDLRTDDTGGRPCGQQTAMDGADELGPEDVGEVGRHGGEPAAIHRQDDAEGADEQSLRSDVSEGWCRRVERDPKAEEGEVRRFAADLVRHRRPEEPATDVEQGQQADEAGGDPGDRLQLVAAELAVNQARHADQLSGEDFLEHRRGHRQHRNACGDVEEQHGPDHPEGAGLVRVIEVHGPRRDERALVLGGRPALRLPTFRRHPIAERADQHDDEITQAEDDEGLPYADAVRPLEVVDEDVGQRGADHRAAAEAHDGHARGHATPIRKPLDQGRDGRDVA